MSRTIFSFLLFNLILINLKISAISSAAPSPGAAKVYIVFTDKIDGHPRDYYVGILTAVMGSYEEARNALLYVYENATHGFAAKLTPQQAKLLLEFPGVLSAEEDQRVPTDYGHRTGPNL